MFYYGAPDRKLLQTIASNTTDIAREALDTNVKLQAIYTVMEQEVVILNKILQALENPPTKPGVAVKFVGKAGTPISKGAKE